MAKKPSKKQAPELFMEPESDDHFACIVGYTEAYKEIARECCEEHGLSWRD